MNERKPKDRRLFFQLPFEYVLRNSELWHSPSQISPIVFYHDPSKENDFNGAVTAVASADTYVFRYDTSYITSLASHINKEVQRKMGFKYVMYSEFRSQLKLSESFKLLIASMAERSKIARVMQYLLKLRIEQGSHLFDKLFSGVDANYITFRGHEVSFLPKGKDAVFNDDGTWSRQNRQAGKPSKVIRKIMTPLALKLFKEKDFEEFNNIYKGKTCLEGYTIQIQDNKSIPNVYEMDLELDPATGDAIGSLGGSCMNGDSEYMDMYKRCRNLRIITMINAEGRLAGRALLWKAEVRNAYGADKPEDNEIDFMDRVYVSRDHYADKFVDFAKENGFYYKQKLQSREEPNRLYSPDGTPMNIYLQVDCNQNDYDSWPYIDTFQWGDGYTLYNEEAGSYTYDCTDGKRGPDDNEDNEDYYYCPVRQESYHIDEMTYVERGRYRDEYVHYDEVVEIDGYWYWREDDLVCYSNYHGEYLKRSDAEWSEYENSYLMSSEAVYYDGDYYHMNTPEHEYRTDLIEEEDA